MTQPIDSAERKSTWGGRILRLVAGYMLADLVITLILAVVALLILAFVRP